MESMEVYHEAMATRIIARVTNGKCEGAEFVFGLIESAIRKEATEIVLIPVQELDMVRMDFGRPYCTIGSPTLPELSLRTWQSILSSLVTSPRKKHAPKDYSADQSFCPATGWLEKRMLGRSLSCVRATCRPWALHAPARISWPFWTR
jgi:hypothetical protein